MAGESGALLAIHAEDEHLIPFGTWSVCSPCRSATGVGCTVEEVTGLKLRNLLTGKVWDFPTSAMFLGIGHTPNAAMFHGALEADEDGYLKTRDYVHTGVPGVYACGDVADRRYRQAITASGTGCMAAIEVERYLEAEGH